MTDTQTTGVSETFCWHEVMTRKPQETKAFYRDLLGWTTSEMDMGPAGTYTMFASGEKQVAGMMAMEGPQWQGIPAHWMAYIAVEDINASTDKAKTLGATIKVPPTEVPTIGWFSVIEDPGGAVISLFQHVGCETGE